MKYDIFSSTAPAMPIPDKGTKFIDFILSNDSMDMREALVPMNMPALAAHLTSNFFSGFCHENGRFSWESNREGGRKCTQ